MVIILVPNDLLLQEHLHGTLMIIVVYMTIYTVKPSNRKVAKSINSTDFVSIRP